MKILFNKKSNSAVIEDIKKTMEGRSLGDLVSLEESNGGLLVKISKLGTSTLQFDRVDQGDQSTYTLTTEKIAFAHRAFKDEVTSKLIQVIEKSGGTVLKA